MTPEQTAILDDMFTRFGYYHEEAEPRIQSYFHDPRKILKIGDILSESRRADEMISDCERMIERMKVLQLALAQRYNELETAPFIPVVRLERVRRYYGYGKVTYYLRTFRRFTETGEQVETSCRTYPGTDRRKAIADYNAHCKAHPGITAELAIDKASWER